MHVPQTRVTIVVTQRESFVHSRRSLESLYASTSCPFSLVYVDGGSPWLTRRYLAREARVRGFTLLRHDRFLSPNRARNLGLAAVRSELVVFAENDVLFQSGWLEALVACHDETAAAVVGPLISFREPAFTTVHSAGGVCVFEPTPSGNSYRNVQRCKPMPMTAATGFLERRVVDFVEFHCFLARTAAVREARFDERLATCCEFDDFCLTLRSRGETVVNEPAAVVHHLLPTPLPPWCRSENRFLRARWDRAATAATLQHFRAKWGVRADDPFLAGVAAWCGDRPYTVVANTPLYRTLRPVKRAVIRTAAAVRRSAKRAPAVG